MNDEYRYGCTGFVLGGILGLGFWLIILVIFLLEKIG